jgi:hypothetical protein
VLAIERRKVMPLRPGVYEPSDTLLEQGSLGASAEPPIAACPTPVAGLAWEKARSRWQRSCDRTWFEHTVYALDRFLRRRQGIYEYTTHAQCLFRIERSRAEHRFTLADGTHIRTGDRILKLHLWNEHIPPMAAEGPTVAWGLEVCRAIGVSLSELVRYMRLRSELDDVPAVCGDMYLGSPSQGDQFARIVARYGFETLPRGACWRPTVLHRLGENMLIVLLVLVTNPVVLRQSALRPFHRRVFMSRGVLERNFGAGAAERGGRVRAPARRLTRA